jgi:hypothetical protein
MTRLSPVARQDLPVTVFSPGLTEWQNRDLKIPGIFSRDQGEKRVFDLRATCVAEETIRYKRFPASETVRQDRSRSLRLIRKSGKPGKK